jgi:hypothetical protein
VLHVVVSDDIDVTVLRTSSGVIRGNAFTSG